MTTEHHIGHRARLREKYLKTGSKGFHDYELMELLLTYAIPQRDVKPIAKELFKRFHSFSGIIDAPLLEISKVSGFGKNSSILVKLIKDISAEYLAAQMREQDVLTSPASVTDFARMKLSGHEDESFMVIYLNTKNHVSDYEIIQTGTIDRAIIYPRNLIKKSLASNASGLIIVHNHPSGICDPSDEDKTLTTAVKNAVEAVNIRFLDHLIVGKSGYFSFFENGLLSS
ncbi:MAG: hypothetical protein A2020_02245 [Lentisphaerae bacterium GWF2_45_14]|nr:MAG: hypothetical protein A2020_02245 [Lentisphaerae bacterium GWF2_45_14]